ncbi:hypothetical protein Cde04nite_15500 [Cellulomonas denverensis]|nr:hypothetical protein Cde04nite_15500 [Cellulomonas denverensis]
MDGDGPHPLVEGVGPVVVGLGADGAEPAVLVVGFGSALSYGRGSFLAPTSAQRCAEPSV